jgi:hypothetical protein
MAKKLLITVASLLASAAFAVIPALAQAAATSPHYYKGEGAATLDKEGQRIPVVAFGTLKLTILTYGASMTCHDVAGGWVENPVGVPPETGHAGRPA